MAEEGSIYGTARPAHPRWRVTANEDLRDLPHGYPLCVAAAPASTSRWRWATGTSAGCVLVHRADDGVEVIAGSGEILSLAAADDGRLAIGSADGIVGVWSPDEPDEPVRVLVPPDLTGSSADWVNALCWEEASLLAGLADGRMVAWDLSAGAAGLHVTSTERGPILTLDRDPVGGEIAAGHRNQGVTIWSATQPRELVAEHPGRGRPSHVAWHPSSGQLASSRPGDAVEVTDRIGSSPDLELRIEGTNRIAWSPRGAELAIVGDGGVWVYDVRVPDAPPCTSFRHQERVGDLAWSADGTELATVGDDGRAHRWEVGRPHRVSRPLSGHTPIVHAIAWSGDGHRLAAAASDGDIYVWDQPLGGAAPTRLSGHRRGVRGVAWSPDSRRLASGGNDGDVLVWEVDDPSWPQARSAEPHSEVKAIAWGPGPDRLTTVAQDGTLRLWRASDLTPLDEVEASSSPLGCIAVSPDGSLLACPSGVGEVRVWRAPLTMRGWWRPNRTTSLAATTSVRVDRARPPVRPDLEVLVNALAWHPSGGRVTAAHEDQGVVTWRIDTETGAPLEAPAATGEHDNRVYACAWDPAGSRLATAGNDRSLRIWADGHWTKPEHESTGKVARIYDVAWHPDGSTLATAHSDGMVVIWTVGETLRLTDRLMSWSGA